MPVPLMTPVAELVSTAPAVESGRLSGALPPGMPPIALLSEAGIGGLLELFGGLDAKTVQQLHHTLGQLRVQMLPDTRSEETRS